MTKNEYELFDILRESEEPELCVLTAIKVFSSFVEKHEAAQVLQAEDLLVSS